MADESLVPASVPPALDLIVQRVPAAVIQQGHEAAKALKDIVDRMPNKVILNGKQYLTIEAWQVLGRFYNVTAKVVESRYVEYGEVKGFEARAVALHGGAEISAAEAACLSDEARWRSRPVYEWADGPDGKRTRTKVGDELVPLFQLKSMAQTRACAKVLRTCLAWVVVLAGYEPTPAEEMPEPEKKPKKGSATPPVVESALEADPGAPLMITKVDVGSKKTGASGKPYQRFTIWFSDGTKATTIRELIGSLAQECWKQRIPIRAEIRSTEWGPDLTRLERADLPEEPQMLRDSDIPF